MGLRLIKLLEVVVELIKRSWTYLNHQKVKKLSKVENPQRLKKFAKVIGLEESSFLTSDTKLAFMKIA